MSKPELIIERHENGQTFIELDSLIEWFETREWGDSKEGKAIKEMGKYAAYTLRGMKERAFNSPNRTMTEDEYKKTREQH